MESEIKQNPPQERQYLWSVFQMSLAAGFAGPIAGCYFLGNNYKKLGAPDYAKKSYLAGILITILLLIIINLVPEDLIALVPRSLIPIACTSLVVTFANYYQKQLIEEKMGENVKSRSYWWCFLLILSLIIIQVPFILLFGVFFSAMLELITS